MSVERVNRIPYFGKSKQRRILLDGVRINLFLKFGFQCHLEILFTEKLK